MKFFIVAILFAFSCTLPVFAADATTVKNAGFVPANIWYSKDPFFTGDKVRIYTVLFNGSTYDLVGSLEFLDNGTSIGKTSFSIARGGRVQDEWVDWTATGGDHVITARIVDASMVEIGGKKTPIVLENTETGKSERTIDVDPVVKKAQAEEVAQKTAALKTEAVSKVQDVAQTVSDAIPLPVKTNVASGANAVETFRLGEANYFLVAKENKAKEIEAIKKEEQVAKSAGKQEVRGAVDTMLNATEKPFAYVLLALFTALHFLFKWQIIFYAVVIYALYRLVKWGIRKVKDR